MVFSLYYTVNKKRRDNKKEEKDYKRILSVYKRKKVLLKIVKDKRRRLY